MSGPEAPTRDGTERRSAAFGWPPASTGATIAFGLCLLPSLLAAGTCGLFFLIGLVDGSVSFGNADDWAIALLLCFGIPAAGLKLRQEGHVWWATALLALLALPTLLLGFALLVFVLGGGRWQ